MKHIKLFKEGVRHENQEISFDEWSDQPSPHDISDKTINDLKSFVSKWGAKVEKEIDCYWKDIEQVNYVGVNINWLHKNSSEISIEIEETEDEWFWIKVQQYQNTEGWLDEKYYKCDQLGGLKEKIAEIFKDVKPIKNPQSFMSTQNLKEEIRSYKKDIRNKIDTLGFNQETLKRLKKISEILK